jgi:hypothetical protein
MYDDAALIAGEAGRLVGNEGKDVMLVAHSYGGIPATESIKGLSKRERQRDGKGPGGIVRIGYVTCLTPVVGESAADVLAQVPPDRRDQLAADVSWTLSLPRLQGPLPSCRAKPAGSSRRT